VGPGALELDAMEPDTRSLILGLRSSAEISLSLHIFLDL
jgi:hypothetical protein